MGSREPKLYIAEVEEILSGEATDIYFVRTREILEKHRLGDTWVRMEIHAYSFPKGYDWAVFAGLEEALALLKGKKVNVYAIPEGTLFKPIEPVMVVEGPYNEISVYETSLLGILRHATSIATRAARIKKLAGNKQVLFFGLRSLHPAIQPMADRAAYIGGVDGVSGVLSKKYIGVEPKGTMPHALILVFGDPVKAWKAFDEVMPENVPRIALADTMYDERLEALMAAQALGDRLYGVRFDTPGSRRGSMRKIVLEARWALDIHGFKHVKIFVSGGINEKAVVELRDIVDGFGVGTSIAFPPSIDLSMDIVEKMVNGKWIPLSKRGKWPGMKQIYRCRPGLNDVITPWNSPPPKCSDGSRPVPLLKKYMEQGKVIVDLPSVDEIRRYVLKQLEELPEPTPV